MEGYSDISYKEVQWTKTWHSPVSGEDTVETAVAVVEHGVVRVSEELFDSMMSGLGFVKVVG